MQSKTFLTTLTLALATSPVWACGTGDPTLLISMFAGLMLALLVLVGISLIPAFVLALRSQSRARWGAFALGAGLAPWAGYEFGPLMPWDSLAMCVVGLLCMMSAAGVLPGLLLERLRRRS